MKRKKIIMSALLAMLAALLLSACDHDGDDDDDDDDDGIALMSLELADGSGVDIESTVTFGDVNIGESVEKTFSIVNTGEVDFTMGDSWLFSDDFSLASPENGALLSPGGSLSFSITFSPGSYGDKTGDVTLNFDGVDTFTFGVSGKGLIVPETLEPPAWIHGVWKDVPSSTITWVFTSDNVTYSASGQSYDFGQLNVDYANQGLENTGYYDSEPTSSSYRIESKQNGNVIGTYDFVSIDADSLNYTVNGTTTVEMYLE